MISSSQLISYGGSWNTKCDNSYNSLCGSSHAISNTYFYCTDYSVSEDWTVGENNFTYTFHNSEKQWHVSWKVETAINLAPRWDNGKINSSPVTRSPPIVRFPGGCRQSFRIPVEDPDGDTVKCRFATYSESFKVNTSFPYGELDETSCLLTYDGSQAAVGGIYAIALSLEDFPAGTTNFGSVTPFSSIPLQFLVMVVGNHAGHCDEKPVFTATTPKDGECSDVPIGSSYRAVIEVQVADFSKSIVEISTASPSGMQLTSLRNQGQIYYRNVTWYPSQHQIGQQLFCFKAVDSAGLESDWRCVTILVGMSSTPRVILATRRPLTPVSRYGSGYSSWSVQFDRLIKKPRTSAYIRLVLLPSGQTLYKVEALSKNVTVGSNSTTLQFAIPYPVLSMDGLYAISMDKGIVVGQGCSSGGTPTPGISSLSDWRFYINGVCSSGYSLRTPYFNSCADIDECAYTGSTGPSNIFPEFTLPAGCDQDCDNTPGNYSCSCERGFQLQSDGKSCTAGYGSVSFKMDFYKNSSFATPFTEQDYPLSVALNEYVYLQYSVASTADLVIMAENCKATKDVSFYSWPQYTFLQNGCPEDSTLDYSYNPTRYYQQFKIRALRFRNDYDTVYFHCELLACHRNSPGSRCSKGCIRNKRKRREVTRDEVEQEESTNKVILTGGPVVFKAAKDGKLLDHEPSQSKQTALIGGVAGAGGFCLIAVVALAILLVKSRRTQPRLSNNKNEERAGYKNSAYIPEADVNGNESCA
ncbi:Deleted in malignant brain tumors 1 protein [Stylophora pistillata]|uniref:Deleted in malignant brain tumors 1 protein n=1 Tax=Stylophora pistillata TaxID=50429 RepID=A0A2B4SGX0_STYPI|nr:Deleted in malignant brain tumors 1 protein [Stylophora pistillata]